MLVVVVITGDEEEAVVECEESWSRRLCSGPGIDADIDTGTKASGAAARPTRGRGVAMLALIPLPVCSNGGCSALIPGGAIVVGHSSPAPGEDEDADDGTEDKGEGSGEKIRSGAPGDKAHGAKCARER